MYLQVFGVPAQVNFPHPAGSLFDADGLAVEGNSVVDEVEHGTGLAFQSHDTVLDARHDPNVEEVVDPGGEDRFSEF